MKRQWSLVLLILLFPVLMLLAATWTQASPVVQATLSPMATPTFDPGRLDKPDVSDEPTQLDEGTLYYWGVCMACHGDVGQGLTEEWRNSYGPEERACWTAGCHGPDHPPESFLLPLDSLPPPMAGPGALARFNNAHELHEYILTSMPWWKPGSMTSDTAWALSAYLKSLLGTEIASLRLGPTNASAIPVHRSVSTPQGEVPGALALAGVLALASVGLALQSPARRSTSELAPPRPNFAHHLHPPTVPATQARWRYTLGAGGLAVFLTLVLLATGLLEMYFYIPSPEHAAISVERITILVPFGALTRNLHFWSAQALVVVMSLHLLRVILTGAYASPRRLNYLIGLGLLVLILLLDFTGYVLRWDEGIRWALVVGANLLKTVPRIGEGLYRFVIGGSEPGPAALSRFFAWHVFGLSLGAAFLTGWHAFRVRRDGGIAVPPPTRRANHVRISRFELIRREVLAMTLAGAALVLVSLALPAPIDQPITGLGAVTSDSRAPWFFLWVQQLLKWGDPFTLGVLVPVLVVTVLGLLPFLLPAAHAEELGRWFPHGNRLVQIIAASILLAIVVLTITGAISG